MRERGVRAMLGVVDREYLYRIVDALLAGDGPALLAEADALAARGLRSRRRSTSSRRSSIASRSCRRCPEQPAGDDAERIAGYAARMSPESVQLAYQICAQGRADLALAPDEATGFTMTLLRLLRVRAGSGVGRSRAVRRAAGAHAHRRRRPLRQIASDVDRNIDAHPGRNGPRRKAIARRRRRHGPRRRSCEAASEASSNAQSAPPSARAAVTVAGNGRRVAGVRRADCGCPAWRRSLARNPSSNPSGAMR